MTNKVMSGVEHVVFVMLENRSLDNVLGYCYGGGSQPRHVFPPGSPPTYDGLVGRTFTQPAYDIWGNVKQYPIVAMPAGQEQERIPNDDPYEDLKHDSAWNGVMNQLFGNQNLITGLPARGTVPTMQGFLQDYYEAGQWNEGLDITWMYRAEQLPNLNALARNYAVSDAWHCSVPSQTNPNRAYSICGTSLGRESNLRTDAEEQFDCNTIFNALAGAGKSRGLYFTDPWVNGFSYTEYTFPWISRVKQDQEVSSIAVFLKRAQRGALPAFSYIEPKWGYGKGVLYKQGTDMHPPAYASPGDAFLGEIYRALADNPQAFAKTLLVITFDEHGGTFDHARPTWSAINPDGKNGTSGFAFDLFGVRVPTILVSPLIRPGTVFRSPDPTMPFDHTSFIKTLLLWAGSDPNMAGMGKRMPRAPTFDGLFADRVVNEAKVEMVDHPAHTGPLDDILEGIPGAVIRRIVDHEPTLDAIVAAAAIYRRSGAY